MTKIPRQRKPGQTGNWTGHGKNASAFNARQRSGGSKGCAIIMIAALLIGAVAAVGGFGLVVLVL